MLFHFSAKSNKNNVDLHQQKRHSSEKKRFMLDEKFQQNASKFAIFYNYENLKLLFPFRTTLFFPLINVEK